MAQPPSMSANRFDTLALHAGAAPDPTTGARATPIYQTTSFSFRDSDHAAALFNMERAGHVYSRISNPTVAVFEERVAALENGAVRCFEIVPEDVGLARTTPETLRGGDAEANAKALKAVLKGTKGPYRDVAVLNAAAALVVAAKAKDLAGGVALAQNSIDSGEAEASLGRLIAVSGKDVEPDVQGEGTPHGEIDRQFLDSTAMREELGWQASWELDRGLRAAWDWYERRLV